jgi:benzoyl-CoA 2,3-dioxygenase component B
VAQSLESIPNNVDLSSDRRLQRALEQWQPNFLSWWKEVGPEGFQAHLVYLRTAISVEANGWAHFDFVRMPEYRWGIFLDPKQERKIGFGDNEGQPVWEEVPGEHRNALRRIIVTQADTEPASVEQQRLLGKTCPSMYDLRNIFQVNVEEGRHLWAMVYLLHRYFGRDGREEADELLARRSGSGDKPRILNTFNEPIDDWLSFFMFTMFTDRDGKYQLSALAQSGFDPLARTTRFMLTEEAHHMFVGETGVDRVVQRCAELMAAGKDPRKEHAVPFELIQKYINFWFSLSLDLFGGEVSSNAADFFASGLKGRFREDTLEEHKAVGQTYRMEVPEGGTLVEQEVPLRNAMNEVLRDEYVKDCQRGLDRWNKTVQKAGVTGMTLRLPHRRFHRSVGPCAGLYFDPDGKLIPEAEFKAHETEWLPTAEDRAYVKSLMHPVVEPGKMASWVAGPSKGINGRPIEFEYVKPPDA